GIAVPVTVGGHDGEILAAGELACVVAGTIRAIVAAVLKVFSDIFQCRAQGGAATGPGVEQASEPVSLVAVPKQAIVVFDRDVEVGLVSRFVDDSIADTVLFAEFGENLAGSRFGQAGAQTVVGEPVGVVLDFFGEAATGERKSGCIIANVIVAIGVAAGAPGV